MALLAFETSCDETSVALIDRGRVLSSVVSSQIELHSSYGGVVPELAAREHLRNLIPVAQAALDEAGVAPAKLDAVAATQGPGLPSALMAGFKAAQAVAFVLRKPFVGIHHHEAHLFSPWMEGDPPVADFSRLEPNVSLIVSGGHTLLVHVESETKQTLLGSTVDDAAGECFDKTGKLMGLAYPAGPQIDRLSDAGNPRAFEFPRPMLHEPHDDFSFSGLKTAVRYFLRDNPAVLEDGQRVRDLCASVQSAIVEVLVTKTLRAARRLRVGCVTASGGVTCNRQLRKALTNACGEARLKLRLAARELCTDNAAMIGALAERKLLRAPGGTSLDADILPSWGLENVL
jgi:N6-L-threonylcarbamoyladenine synthase